MNSLSWLIYLADVASNLSTGAAIISVVGFFLMFAPALVGRILVPIFASQGDEEAQAFLPTMKMLWRFAATIYIVAFVVALVAPSRNTVLAIAASEAGERIAKSENVSEIANDASLALRQWIKKQIEPEKGSK
jgi:hypothetical protein